MCIVWQDVNILEAVSIIYVLIDFVLLNITF